MHYYIGNFNGYSFTKDETSEKDIKWLDYGSDFYAGITWNNIYPERIMIGWINNWNYANKISKEWNGGHGLARKLLLINDKNNLKLVQIPVDNIKNYRKECFRYNNDELKNGVEIKKGNAYEVYLHISGADNNGFSVVIDDISKNIYATITYSEIKKELNITKKNVIADKNASYVTHVATYNATEKEKMRLFIDDNTLTMFTDKGDTVFTELLFSYSNDRRIINKGSRKEILEATIWRLSFQ